MTLIFRRIKSSVAVAYPLRGLTCCVLRDALLHTTVVMHVFFFALLSPRPVWPFSSDLSHFYLQNCTHWMFFHSLQTLETVVCENPRRSAVSVILKPPCLPPTIIPWSKSLWSHFFLILTFGQKKRWTSWPCLHAFMHLVAATFLAD